MACDPLRIIFISPRSGKARCRIHEDDHGSSIAISLNLAPGLSRDMDHRLEANHDVADSTMK
jgi:hypothetical protein